MPIIHRAIKKMHQDAKKTAKNAKTKKDLRKALKNIRDKANKKNLPKITSMIDKAAKSNLIHKNKAARIKSRLSKNLHRQRNPKA